MAGAYPNAPGERMAWDDDGTVILGTAQNFSVSAGTPPNTAYSEVSVANKEIMNDEDIASFWDQGIGADEASYVTSLYARKREIDGIYYVFDANVSEVRWVATSVDSTNGRDGTFTDLSVTSFDIPGRPVDGYRDDIHSKAESNVVSLMFYGAGNLRNRYYFTHVYGVISPGETPDRILFLDPDDSDDEFILPLDFGDVPRGQTQTDTVKVRNNSGSLTANTVQLIVEDLSDGSGAWYTLSDDDIVYTATLSIGNLSPGGTQLVHVRQIVPDAQAPGVYSSRVQVGQASWS